MRRVERDVGKVARYDKCFGLECFGDFCKGSSFKCVGNGLCCRAEEGRADCFCDGAELLFLCDARWQDFVDMACLSADAFGDEDECFVLYSGDEADKVCVCFNSCFCLHLEYFFCEVFNTFRVKNRWDVFDAGEAGIIGDAIEDTEIAGGGGEEQVKA